MELQCREVLLSGHTLADYQKMFDLTADDLNKKILTCACGFDSFNAEMYAQGKTAISCDQLFLLPNNSLNQQMMLQIEMMTTLFQENRHQFILQQAITEEIKKRQQAMHLFFQDFHLGKIQGRYRWDKLAYLPFEKHKFQLALCSHFLFANNQLTPEFHVKAIEDMCRVAKEVRVFPILNTQGEFSPSLGPALVELQERCYDMELREVNYEFQKNGNALLRIWTKW